MKKKLLIVGIDSTLGSLLPKYLIEQQYSYYGTSRRQVNPEYLYLDFVKNIDEFDVNDLDIDVAVIFAGVTSIAECELNKHYAYEVNVNSTIKLIKKLIAQGVFIIFPSSNYVFDGSRKYIKPFEVYSPNVEYGRHQVAVEKYLLKEYPENTCILRMSKVLCANFSLIQTWISALLNGVEISPFSDLYMAPISTESVMQSLIQISTAKMPGIYQFSASDDINYIEAANVIADTLSLDKTLIVSTYGRDNKILPQTLERHHTLDCSRAISELQFQCPDPGELTAEVAIETYKTITEQERIYRSLYEN